jgi:hypothetical protein
VFLKASHLPMKSLVEAEQAEIRLRTPVIVTGLIFAFSFLSQKFNLTRILRAFGNGEEISPDGSRKNLVGHILMPLALSLLNFNYNHDLPVVKNHSLKRSDPL